MVATHGAIHVTESGLLTALRMYYKGLAIRLLITPAFPFVMCIVGYYVASTWWGVRTVAVPHIVGVPSHIALEELSQRHLYPHVIGRQEHSHLDGGTVVEQIPQAGKQVKANQTIYIVISRAPQQLTAPSCIGMHIEEARNRASQLGVQIREYYIPSMYPHHHVVAQVPGPGEPFDYRCIIAYVSNNNARWCIMPSLIDHDLFDVVQFCEMHDIPIYVFSRTGKRISRNTCAGQYIVAYQKPIAGSFIDITHPPVVHIVAVAYEDT